MLNFNVLIDEAIDCMDMIQKFRDNIDSEHISTVFYKTDCKPRLLDFSDRSSCFQFYKSPVVELDDTDYDEWK